MGSSQDETRRIILANRINITGMRYFFMALPPSDRTFKQDLVTGIPIGQQKESAVRPLEKYT
jgi:hypothetical protein